MVNYQDDRLCENCNRGFIPKDDKRFDPLHGKYVEELQLLCVDCQLDKDYPKDEEDSGPEVEDEEF